MKFFGIGRSLLAAPLFLALALQAPAVHAAGKVETPSTLPGGSVVSADEAKKLVEGKLAFFVDTRSVLNFGKGHVPGATAVAYKEVSEKVVESDASKDQFDLGKLPQDKNAKLVFYSDGPTGWKSYKAAVLAVKAGYKNVMYMRGGFAEWSAKGYPVEQ